MRIALGVLCLSPDQFWRMTPREMAAAIGGLTGPGPEQCLPRSELTELMNRFPDEVNHG